MDSLQAALQAARLVWAGGGNTLTIYDSLGTDVWDTYRARMYRYKQFERFYENTIYDAANMYAVSLKEQGKLYTRIRGIYNPVARYVEMYVASIWGGALDLETLETGAIPLTGIDNRMRDAIRNVWIWSNWARKKNLIVRNGATLGDYAIKVHDNRMHERVMMEPLHPSHIFDYSCDSAGNIDSITIQYNKPLDPYNPQGQSCVYTEIIDREMFRTFKDHQPYAWYADAEGMPVSEWPNEYGFVPVVVGPHMETGRKWSRPGFAGSALPKINEANDYASLKNDNLRQAVRMILYGPGTSKQELADPTVSRDEILILHGPTGSDLKPVVAPIDIQGALANLDSMLMEIEKDMPELALASIRQRDTNLTAPGVRAAFTDAISRINEARINYDDTLCEAQQMALAIGGMNGYDGFAGFSREGYLRGDYAHHVRNRPVIHDTLTQKERIDILLQLNTGPRMVLEEMQVSEDKIREIEAAQEQRARDELSVLTNAVFGAEDQDDQPQPAMNGNLNGNAQANQSA